MDGTLKRAIKDDAYWNTVVDVIKACFEHYDTKANKIKRGVVKELSAGFIKYTTMLDYVRGYMDAESCIKGLGKIWKKDRWLDKNDEDDLYRTIILAWRKNGTLLKDTVKALATRLAIARGKPFETVLAS